MFARTRAKRRYWIDDRRHDSFATQLNEWPSPNYLDWLADLIINSPVDHEGEAPGSTYKNIERIYMRINFEPKSLIEKAAVRKFKNAYKNGVYLRP